MARRLAPFATLAVALGVLAGGCATGLDGFTLTITAWPATCDLSRTRIPAGRTTFVLRNNADLPVSVAIGKPVGGSRVELPTVAPGESDTTDAGLIGGEYTVTCLLEGGPSPTAPLLVTGDRSEEPPVAQTVALVATDTTLTGPETFRARAGDRVRFTLSNAGTAPRSLRLVGPDGTALAELAPVEPGGSGAVAASLDRNGAYAVQLVDGAGQPVEQLTLVVGR